MSKKCQISYRKANNANAISHSHIKTKKLQNINLQKKKVWSTLKSRWLRLRISTKTIKSRHKISI